MAAKDATVLETALHRDRMVVIIALAVVVVAAWIWIAIGAGTGMTAIGTVSGSAMPDMPTMMVWPAAWTPTYAGLIFAMWWVMMAAMMLPSAAPILLLFARINRAEKARDRPYVPTGMFAAGYLIAWGGFSALATGLQWGLTRLDVLSVMMVTTSYWIAGALLLGAGIWQLTSIKAICLRHCRSPIGFLAQRWRPGWFGAFAMGLEHGGYCLGCCWLLMSLLFFGGIMNLYWIAGLAAFILLEKTAPMGSWIGRIAGGGVAVWGIAMLAAATLSSASPNDYRFDAITVQSAGAGRTTIAVRLVHLPDEEPVVGAVVIEATTNMRPSGMAEMSGKVTPLPPERPGIYQFLTETAMTGKWELVLQARMPNEPSPVRGVVIYDAMK